MSIPYLNIARAVALKTGQFADAADAAAFETIYTTALATALDGFELPLSELKRLILASEKKIAAVCCRQSNPVLKIGMADKSASLLSGAAIPSIDDDTDEWIGAFDGVYDTTTHQPLTEKPKQAIFRYNRRIAASELRLVPFHYCFDGGFIFHTRSGGAYIGGYGWDYAAQVTAYGASGNSPLAQECEDWWIADCLANAAQEGWFTQEAQGYFQIAQAAAEAAEKGVVPTRFLPDTTASIEEVKN